MNSTTTTTSEAPEISAAFSSIAPFFLFLFAFMVVYIHSCCRKEKCCRKNYCENNSQIENYTRAWFIEIKKESLGDTCAICLSKKSFSKSVAVLPCGHRFHEECILEWLDEQPNCPICRAHVAQP